MFNIYDQDTDKADRLNVVESSWFLLNELHLSLI